MPAQPDRIARITRQFLPVIAGPDPGAAAAYGNAARDNLTPVETFFETEAAAQAMADERLALLGTTRRRFSVGIADAQPALALDYAAKVPTAHVIDDDRSIAADALITGFTVELATGDATLKVFA